MMKVDLLMLIMLFLVIFVLFLLLLWRYTDLRAERSLWLYLSATQPVSPKKFSIDMLMGLPEPAQRYFRFSIQPGTPLYRVAEISMVGQFSLGTKAAPNYMAMKAEQILAAPIGFIWKLKASRGVMTIYGSDMAKGINSWGRYWLLGLIPVARFGGDFDYAKAAFGRYIAEALFWTPAALLPQAGVVWKHINQNCAAVRVTYGPLQQDIEISVDKEGRPEKVSFMRWSNANPEKTFKNQPFGGYLSDFKDFNGFCLPTHIEAGNFFGNTKDYFPFFCAEVTDIRFPVSS